MQRLVRRLAPLAVVLLAVSGCSGSDDPIPTEPGPTPVIKNETFTGILTLNGAATFPFTVVGVGTTTATLTSLTPDSAKPVGLSLGTWNGSVCQVVLANDASIQGSFVVGQSTTPGNFCARISDAAGTVVAPQTYVIDVAHP